MGGRRVFVAFVLLLLLQLADMDWYGGRRGSRLTKPGKKVSKCLPVPYNHLWKRLRENTTLNLYRSNIDFGAAFDNRDLNKTDTVVVVVVDAMPTIE